MTTATKEAPTKPKPAKQSKKPAFSPEEAKHAVKAAFPAVKGTISVRYLWTTGSVHRFRANWWRENGICDSKFLHVTQKNDKIKVVEK